MSPAGRAGPRLRVISVGRDRDFTAAGCAEYARRLARASDLELIELRAATGTGARVREGEAILASHLRGRTPNELWALDERGTQLTSVELAARLGRLRDRAIALTLCIGGDEGLSESVAGAARFTWSLSRLTLPHRLARLIVLEQLYRAGEILRGGPYHK